MRTSVRLLTIAYGVMLLVTALGLAFQADWATRMWPWPDGRLSFIFIGSVFAAAAAPVIWIGLTGDRAAFQAIALDSVVTTGALAVYFGWLYARRDENALLTATIVAGVLFVIFARIFVWSRRFAWHDPRPTPRLARASFAAFVVALVIAAVALLLRAEHIFPWPLRDDSSVVFGLIFVASAAYYGHAVLRPVQSNATGQWLAFLAYDLVLYVPFVRHLRDVQDDHRLSLLIYLAVLVYSTALALYYLVWAEEKRIIRLAWPFERRTGTA